jgi:hypothetical protein
MSPQHYLVDETTTIILRLVPVPVRQPAAAMNVLLFAVQCIQEHMWWGLGATVN